VTIAVLRRAGSILVLTAFAMMMSSRGIAADLRLRMQPAASRQEPLHKSRKELFEEFLRWRSRHHVNSAD
jgi:hypothetical protein